ncbi:MAG: DNA-directed RNA polymerase subunit alpha C-terminal domain-containing protein [Candidatus Moraniibacteriota bacterium]
MGEIKDNQEKRHPIIAVLHSIGIASRWISERLNLNPTTLRLDLDRLGLKRTKKKTKEEVFASALKFYACLMTARHKLVISSDLDDMLKELLGEYLGIEEVEKEFLILDDIASTLSRPQARAEDQTYVNLIEMIFGRNQSDEASELWHDNLNLYTKSDESDVPQNALDLKKDLRKSWANSQRRKIGAIWDEKLNAVSTIESVLENLTKREILVVRRRCGLGCEQKTYSAIGDDLMVTEERIRQIFHKALRKLRYLVRKNKLQGLYQIIASGPPIIKEDIRVVLPVEGLYTLIGETDLSIRAKNCLGGGGGGFKLVGELAQRTRENLMETKNFGRKSLKEVGELLDMMGLSFGMQFDNFPDPEILKKLGIER